ncbi:transglutaminase-like domain-containing protein [Wenyingzhuangia sp. IMCC45467]
MQYYYNIKYTTHNTYENPVSNAMWQFLIEPLNNDSQFIENSTFLETSDISLSSSINGYGFKTFKVIPKNTITDIVFNASFSLVKNNNEINPLESRIYTKDLNELNSDAFKIEYHPFLKSTQLTSLPTDKKELFLFDANKSTFENLKALNKWIYLFIYYTTGVTNNKTELKDIITNNKGVAQDFSHLFCAMARQHDIPTRFVTGFLNQETDLFGKTEVHAWAECYIPNIGWVGFDPTNNMLADFNHIKIAHGKDYQDCASLKGIVFSSGKSTTKYNVKVTVKEFKEELSSTLNNISTYNLINNKKTH